MKLYLIRHGESQANANHFFVGHTDVDLTEKGYKQAKETAKYLKDIPVDKIYASDLIRAYHTAEETAKLKNMPIEKNTGLRELYCGKLECLPRDELIEKHPEFMEVWCNDIKNTKCESGESVKDLYQRIVKTITEIAKNNPDKTVFIFSHATAIRCFIAYCLKGFDEINNLPWACNASVSEVDYIDGKFNVVVYGYNEFMEDKTI